MVSGVVLGWASPIGILLEREDLHPGETTVVTDDPAGIERLQLLGAPVLRGDPTSSSLLAELDDPEVVLIVATTAEYGIELLMQAETHFPMARRIAITEKGMDSADRGRLRSRADYLIVGTEQTATRVVERSTNPAAMRALRVKRILRDLDGRLCVYTHDNPDPDAIASAIALVRLANHLNVDAKAYYFGTITHQSNRAFINALKLPITQVDAENDLPQCDGLALVDHSIPGQNDGLPEETAVDLIFDHHRPSGPIEGRYVDVRESVGSTCSMLIEYLQQFDVPIDESLATALLYGIRTDTREFSRGVNPLDFQSGADIWELADHEQLAKIANPAISERTIQTIAQAIENRQVRGGALTSCVGECSDKDAISQAADLLVQLNGIVIALVFGIDGNTARASARARRPPPGFDLSVVMRDAFTPIGVAGGHRLMAGAQIPLGFLGAEIDDDDGTLVRVVEEVLGERFFEAIPDSIDMGPGTTDQPRSESDAMGIQPSHSNPS